MPSKIVPYIAAAAEIKLSVRDHLIVDWIINTSPKLMQRMAVLFDYDRDERILDFLTAVHYTCPKIRTGIIGVAESRGRIAVFYGEPSTVDVIKALSLASYRAIHPDQWHVDVSSVPVIDGVLDRAALCEAHPLRSVPDRFQLGLL